MAAKAVGLFTHPGRQQDKLDLIDTEIYGGYHENFGM